MAEKTKDHAQHYDNGAFSKPHKPCRTCTDFQSWMKAQPNPKGKSRTVGLDVTELEQKNHDCPLDKDELGRNTWSFLHTMAAYFPEKPSIKQQTDMKSLINIFSNFYPCEYCASDLRTDMKDYPPDTSGQKELSLWFCKIHNKVNKKLGKPEFDCDKVDERWKDGWKDGSCG
ncbi:hypothetical protein SNE40_021680 [Patella caerulea]|uniref:Sulfhydryl oxidase n=1 Tax=Patella caerulea TaxID=87958 RepID=A0AAN8G4X9_PATCE